MVMLAVEETAQEPIIHSLKYLDRVLEDWQKKGIFTPETLAQEKQKNEKDYQAAKTVKQKPAITQKFKSEDVDLSFLEE